MLELLRSFSSRAWRGRVSARKVRSEIEILKRWSKRCADDRYARDS